MSMNNELKSKINRLISWWPRGAPSAASYLNRQGYSHDLLTNYKKSGWIQSFITICNCDSQFGVCLMARKLEKKNSLW